MNAAVPPRIRWAVDVVAPRPEERLLEIGCGPGVAAALVCDRLTTGHLLAIDRSPTAVARTTARNAAHVAAHRLEVRESTLAGVRASNLDKAFSVNVNVFWTTDAVPELTALRHALRLGGELFVLYGTGPTATDRVTPVIAKAMVANGFTEVTPLSSAAGTGVRAVHSG
ncbi:MAG TPA: methyltransferase domain-containing protein [Actinophytocola sp.]|nr:methyltransferase domain-containing protein [Actinophytocola sp.]